MVEVDCMRVMHHPVKLDLARHSLVLHRQQAEQCLGVALGNRSSEMQKIRET